MAAPAPEVDSTGFTLDEALLAQSKAASARRLYTLQIPAVRAAGFVILSAIVVLQDRADPALALLQQPAQRGLVDLRDAFYVDTDAWKAQVVAQARQSMAQAVSGLAT